MSDTPALTSMLAIYSGQTCIGHMIKRGRQGVEAFDYEDRSLGLYPDQKAAAAAVIEAATARGREAIGRDTKLNM